MEPTNKLGTLNKAPVTLRDVIDTLMRRLNAQPIKIMWREERNDMSGLTRLLGCELVFVGITPNQIMKAMKGLTLIEHRKFKSRAYIRLLRWEVKTPKIKFRCTLYAYANNNYNFVFTSDW